MMLTATAAMIAALAAAPQAAPAQPSRAPQFDQTVQAPRGTKLVVRNFAGEVVVHAWEKDAVRVQARHSPRAKVDIEQTPGGIRVGGSRSAAGSIDYDITIPAWMSTKIEGQFNFISIEGAQGEVSAETVRGDIVIKGGTGFVTARSIEGEVMVDGARGKIDVSSVNEGITIANSSGEIVADTTNGDVTLTRIDSPSVQVTTINGDITYDGNAAASGRYAFTTHNGDIVVAVPETSSVTFSVRTYQGEFSSALPVKGPAASEPRRGRRVQYTLGSGSAEMEIESFGGEIRLRRPGTVRVKEKDKDKN